MFSLNGTTTLNANLTLDVTGASGEANQPIIDGVTPGQLIKDGTGKFTLSATNTFTGDVTVNDGILTLEGSEAIEDTVAVIVNNPGTLQVSHQERIGSLAGDGNVQLNSSILTGGNNDTTAFTGPIFGFGGLTKEGSGVFTLDNPNGTNTYSGETFVNEGTLLANNLDLGRKRQWIGDRDRGCHGEQRRYSGWHGQDHR